MAQHLIGEREVPGNAHFELGRPDDVLRSNIRHDAGEVLHFLVQRTEALDADKCRTRDQRLGLEFEPWQDRDGVRVPEDLIVEAFLRRRRLGHEGRERREPDLQIQDLGIRVPIESPRDLVADDQILVIVMKLAALKAHAKFCLARQAGKPTPARCSFKRTRASIS